jgi:hypothetical protein
MLNAQPHPGSTLLNTYGFPRAHQITPFTCWLSRPGFRSPLLQCAMHRTATIVASALVPQVPADNPTVIECRAARFAYGTRIFLER